MELTEPSFKVWFVSGSLKSALTMFYIIISLWAGISISFHAYLTIVECAPDRQIVDIGIQNSGHLVFLTGADTAFRMQDEYWHIFFATETMNRCRSGLYVFNMFPVNLW